jgi:thioredoxin 2
MATAVPDATVVRCPSCGRKNRVPVAAAGTPRCATCHANLPWMAEADDQQFAAVAEQATVPVLVDIWAPWCEPCRTVTPALEHLAELRAGTIKLVKVNADQSPALSRRFEIRAIPTLLVLRSGRTVARYMGAAPEDRLSAWLDQALASSSTKDTTPQSGPGG